MAESVGKYWKNWAETLKFTPEQVFYPTTKEEIKALVLQARKLGKSIRVVGAGHSFTALIESEYLISLDEYQGLVSVDAKQQLATVKSGTRLKLLGELLFDQGLMMENLGDIDVQSIAGALSTGTHGTGLNFGILSTQIQTLELVTGVGEFKTLTPDDRDEFKAAVVSFGSMGILTEITLQLQPAYKLHYQSDKTTFDTIFEELEKYKTNNRNFEFYWFPHSNHVQTKVSNITEKNVKNGKISGFFNDIVMENWLFGLICGFVRIFPRTAKFFSRVAGATISPTQKIDWGHLVYATVRKVKFVEMEYSIPIDECEIILREIKEYVNENQIRVNFPIEVRFVKQDDIMLSPANGSDRCFIAIHMYKGMPYKEYFTGVEAIYRAHQGKPHWGKMHFLGKTELLELYPDFDKFNNIRMRYDPDGIFHNNHIKYLVD